MSEEEKTNNVVKFGKFYMRSGNIIPFATLTLTFNTQWDNTRGNRITGFERNFVSSFHPITGELIPTISYIDPVNIESIVSECELTVNAEDLENYTKTTTDSIQLTYENKTS